MQKTRLFSESWETRHSENHKKTKKKEPQITTIPFEILSSGVHGGSVYLGVHTPCSWPSWRRGTLAPQRPPQQSPKGFVTWTSGWDRGGLWWSTKRRAESRRSEGSCENSYSFYSYRTCCDYFCSLFLCDFTNVLVLLQLVSKDCSVQIVVFFLLPRSKTGCVRLLRCNMLRYDMCFMVVCWCKICFW